MEETKTIRPARPPQRGQQRVRDRDLAEHVDLELAPHVVGAEELERAADADAGVVHERVEPAGTLLVDEGRGRPHLVRVGDVEPQRGQLARTADGCRERLTGGGIADAREHGPTGSDEPQGARPADPRRCAGDQSERHGRDANRPAASEDVHEDSHRPRTGPPRMCGDADPRR